MKEHRFWSIGRWNFVDCSAMHPSEQTLWQINGYYPIHVKWLKAFMFLVIALCWAAVMLVVLTGCAMSRSTFETADGDTATKMAVSTIGKQEVEQHTDFEVYPNNAGLSLQDGAVSQQDSTALVPVIQALVGAMMQQQGGGTPEPSVLQRLNEMRQQVDALRELVNTLTQHRGGRE